VAFLDISFTTRVRSITSMLRARSDRYTLPMSPELHPTYNLAGTATATSILRKFDTNTEAATANSQPCSSPEQQPEMSN
jgi:hypothetical protein